MNGCKRVNGVKSQIRIKRNGDRVTLIKGGIDLDLSVLFLNTEAFGCRRTASSMLCSLPYLTHALMRPSCNPLGASQYL